jgi:hypothetical protein
MRWLLCANSGHPALTGQAALRIGGVTPDGGINPTLFVFTALQREAETALRTNRARSSR